MMVVSVLIATVSYQASLNPPGGLWQDNKTGEETPTEDQHVAGTAINHDYNGFQWFMIGNTVALFASLVVILFLTSAKTLRWRRLMWMLMALMWISVFSVALSFVCGAIIILRDASSPAVNSLICFGLACMVLFAVVLLLNAFFGLKKICRWLKKKLGLQSQNVDPVSSSLPLQ
ncbi:Ankyrin repeat-containing protein [Nymphaea thermarum]|nr:Ankyrin repeat-containing protein [Nymphaea thermarum]